MQTPPRSNRVSLNVVHENTIPTTPNNNTEKLMMVPSWEEEHTIDNHWLVDSVYDNVQKLSWEHKTLLTLRYFEQKSYADITAIMSLSSKSVAYYKTQEALQALEEQLSEDGISYG